MQREGYVLFERRHLDDFLRARREAMQTAIASLNRDEALRRTEEDLARRFSAEYSVEPVRLDMEHAGLEQPQETHLGDRYDRRIPATTLEYRIPFHGEAALFDCVRSGGAYRERAIGRLHETPEVSILCLLWTVTERERPELKGEIDAELREIQFQIAESNKVVEKFNSELANVARACVAARRQRVRDDINFFSSLGYPLRRYESVPEGFAVPLQQKIIRPMAKAAGVAGPSEPFLEESDYDAVLDALMGMSVAMERSPRAFQTMEEEDLRFVLLVPLNVIFKGETAGEAFNYGGKTDILLLSGGHPVFVAECMVWDGPNSMLDKIEQLRGYARWRDTRLALIVFSRRDDFTAVLDKIRSAITGAPGFLRPVDYRASSGVRCVIAHRDDAAREMVLTILAFHVPTA